MNGNRPRRGRSGAIAVALTTALLASLALPTQSLAGIGFVTSWGTQGTGNGQFDGPTGLATDPAGNVYVADRLARVQKFAPDGGFLFTLGSLAGPFGFPSDVDVDADGNIYVAGSTNEIHKFTSTGALITKWGSTGDQDGQFSDPQGIALGPAGDAYVAGRKNHRVQKFTSNGAFLTKWGKKGKLGSGELKFPEGVDTDAAGKVYVADTEGDRIQKFSSTGTFLTEWGTNGRGDGQFRSPEDVAIDPAGNVYVADTGTKRVQMFTSGGRFLTKWGGKGLGGGQFRAPTGVATDGFGNLYVADALNNRIQKFHELIVKSSAKKTQRAKKLKIKVRCPNEACTLKLSGQATSSGARSRAAGSAKTKRFKLEQRSVALQAGEKRSVRVKLSSSSRKKLSRLIKKGASAKATINVRATAPNLDLEPAKVKVKKLTG